MITSTQAFSRQIPTPGSEHPDNTKQGDASLHSGPTTATTEEP